MEKRDFAPFLLINSDILLTPQAGHALREFAAEYQDRPFFATGQRTELSYSVPEVGVGSAERPRGKKLAPCGADWFFFNTTTYEGVVIPGFQFARYSYDNWMIWDALKRGLPAFDLTESAETFHLTHPEQPGIRASEGAQRNRALAEQSYPDWTPFQGWVNQLPKWRNKNEIW